MSNSYFNATGIPATDAALTSATLRSELANIAAGFDKLPPLAGNGSKAVRVNAGGTALEAADGGSASVTTYTPATSADWSGSVPTTVAGALDTLATRVRINQNAQAGNYTLILSDQGKHIYHDSGAGAGDTYTIPANASVAYTIGTTITFVNLDSNSVAIAITTDTMYLASSGSTGTRTLAAYGVATALKLTSTAWLISGTGIT